MRNPFKNTARITGDKQAKRDYRKNKSKFYCKQAAKAAAVLILSSVPIDFTNGYVTNLAANMDTIGAQDSLIYSSNLSMYSTMSAGIFVLGLYIITCRINWKYPPYDTKA